MILFEFDFAFRRRRSIRNIFKKVNAQKLILSDINMPGMNEWY
jgi:CheY-like chemotaxis protein